MTLYIVNTVKAVLNVIFTNSTFSLYFVKIKYKLYIISLFGCPLISTIIYNISIITLIYILVNYKYKFNVA